MFCQFFLKWELGSIEVHNIQVSLKNKSQQYTFDIFMAPLRHMHTHPALDDFAKSYYWIINVASFPRILLGVNICSFPQRRGLKGMGGITSSS